ncbi:glycoside hydrolase family 3 protein [Gracilimonas mengyeensis]|uniref:beta-N-acetylhexosaminidase n=1 Tax=Gracilimonas mengyeensis TaxID=1302730 RepID=A0A521DQB0_9BACT|nr:glycoside hydrolase family 3 N-terminal domain-containing protein [Gracilimonas mengyeensis]SMO73818.1 beta-N-acetylhexosaminidase [Gracilimonas mengyeensis]
MIRIIAVLLWLAAFSFLGCAQENPKADHEDEIIPAERLGQLILVGFRGTELTEDSPVYEDLTERNIAGVVLFDRDVITGNRSRNIEDPSQLMQLTNDIIASAPTSPIIAVDQEGGLVSRLKESKGFPESVSAEYLGNLDNEDSTRHYARIMAQEFMVVGTNTNFAPVLDVNTNPDNPVIGKLERSYSSNPIKVAEHAGYTIDEYSKEGMLSVLKHFPGHGSSTTDSHLGFTDVTDTWSKEELIPYRELFAQDTIRAVMTAHIFNAKIDSVWPATLSDKTINGLLRDSLGFEGVVFSDDMQMDAIREEYGLETAIQQALNAGVDILIFGNNLVYEEDIAERAIGIIQKLLREGKVEKETVEKALARVDALKEEVIAPLCSCMDFLNDPEN